ncbi:MAG: MFS transporter [Saezia sp.]
MTGSLSLFNAATRTTGREYYLMLIVGLAHAASHYCQIVLMMLASRITVYFGVDTVAIGAVVSVFYITSCVVQAGSGFIVDKIGARPVMYFGLVLMLLGLCGYALSSSYWMLFPSAMVLGFGTGVFHPTDYTLLNKLVSTKRLGMAYSIHGITGTLGWALTPITVVPIARFYDSWQAGMWAAVIIVGGILLVVLAHFKLIDQYQYDSLEEREKAISAKSDSSKNTGSSFAFLKMPVIWMCMLFFFFFALSNSAIQTFSKDAIQGLFHFEETAAALCISVFMVASCFGIFIGGYFASEPSRSEKIIAFSFTCSAILALVVAWVPLSAVMVYVMFALMGASMGMAGPSRDLIVRRATPPGATGRVFGVVYAGLDVGQAVAPLIYARFIDSQNYAGLFIALAVIQMVLITSAFNAGRSAQGKTHE